MSSCYKGNITVHVQCNIHYNAIISYVRLIMSCEINKYSTFKDQTSKNEHTVNILYWAIHTPTGSLEIEGKISHPLEHKSHLLHNFGTTLQDDGIASNNNGKEKCIVKKSSFA